MNTHLNALKSYLLSALDKSQNILFLESFRGAKTPNPDLENCEFLEGVGLLNEEPVQIQQGNNCRRVFHLTEIGKQIAQELKSEEPTQANLKLSFPNKLGKTF